MFRVGEIVSIVKLKNAYDAYAMQVIGSLIQRQEQEWSGTKQNGKFRRLPAKYKILKALPTEVEYKEMRKRAFTSSAEDLMNQAYEEITTLGEELRGWFDNLSEGLQQSSNAERINEAADALENISAQDSIDMLSDIEVYHPPCLDCSSRSKRAGEVASILNDVASAIREYDSENRENASDSEDDSEEDPVEKSNYSDSDFDEAISIADQCETDAGEVEGIEFPSMYG